MRRPFPVHRTGTITRANIEQALAWLPELDDPEKLSAHLVGYPSTRHVRRCARLMKPRPSADGAGKPKVTS